MKRREFIAGLAGAAAAWPVVARAQQAVPLIGYLAGWPSDRPPRFAAGFQAGLKETGLVEGRDFSIEYRSTGEKSDRLLPVIAETVASRVSVLVAVSDSIALAAKAATAAIPIVYIGGNDPVKIGLVSSLNRPGGNVTGVTVLNVEIAAKRFQLMNEMIPSASSFAALLDSATPNFDIDSNSLIAAAKAVGTQVHIVPVSTLEEVGSALVTIAKRQLGPVVVGPSPFFNNQSPQLGALFVRHALPAIFQTREFVAAGGLVSYGGSLLDVFRIAGTYTGRVLKGERPSNLPVQQANKFETFINLKSAKALGLDVPATLLARADEVIE